MSGISMELIGIEGAQARMKEIQARIKSLRGEDFGKSLSGAMGAPMQPPSVPTGAIDGGYSPLSPLSGSLQIGGGGQEAIKAMVRQVAQEKGVDANLFEALVAKESSFDPRARSRAGAMGLTQLMPDTARELGVTDPFDPMQNLRGGASYLKKMLAKYNGDTRLALAAYNAGPGAVDRAGGVPRNSETPAYVARVMGLADALGG